MIEIKIADENIEKLKELAQKDSVNQCVVWILEHYHMVGEEVVRLQDVNKDLKSRFGKLCERNAELNSINEQKAGVIARQEKRIEELKARVSELETEKTNIGDIKVMFPNIEEIKDAAENIQERAMGMILTRLEKENEELKAQIRSLVAMDHEEPYEKIDELRNRIIELESENDSLKSENENCKQELKKSKDEAFREHNSAFDYRMHLIDAEGQIKAYQWMFEHLGQK